MAAADLSAGVEEVRAMLREARARGLTPDEQKSLDELITALLQLLMSTRGITQAK